MAWTLAYLSLTVYSLRTVSEQAIERSGTKQAIKVAKLPLTAIEMVNLLKADLTLCRKHFKQLMQQKRKARRFAVQGIYEWQMSHNPVHEIEARTRVENAMHKVDLGYYHELLTQVVANHEALDALLIRYSIANFLHLTVLNLRPFVLVHMNSKNILRFHIASF